MADDFITVEWQGDETLLIELERTEFNLFLAKRRIPARLAAYAKANIQLEAPGGSTSGIYHATDSTGSFFHPGGAGGGGNWEAQAGVKTVPSIHGPSLYPLYVHEGTANKGRGFIYPRDDRLPASVTATRQPRRMNTEERAALAFMYRGEKIFRSRIEGQKPNPYVQRAFRRTLVYARTRMHTLGREIVAGL